MNAIGEAYQKYYTKFTKHGTRLLTELCKVKKMPQGKGEMRRSEMWQTAGRLSCKCPQISKPTDF